MVCTTTGDIYSVRYFLVVFFNQAVQRYEEVTDEAEAD